MVHVDVTSAKGNMGLSVPLWGQLFYKNKRKILLLRPSSKAIVP